MTTETAVQERKKLTLSISALRCTGQGATLSSNVAHTSHHGY